MQVWTYPLLVGLALVVGGLVIFAFPEIVSYFIAALLVLGGILMLALAYSMWKEARKLDQIIRETEAEIEKEIEEFARKNPALSSEKGGTAESSTPSDT